MANKHKTLDSLFTDIADTIRSKTKSTDSILADEFPDAIGKITGGTGNATPSDVLIGKTFTNNSGEQTGTMPNNGETGTTLTVQGSSYDIPSGYTSGGKVEVQLTPSTITSDSLNLSTYESKSGSGDYDAKATITIPEGYYEETSLVKTMENIFPAPASEGTNDKLLSGYTLYNHEGKIITGIMANNTTGGTITTQGGTYTIPQGYTSGGTVTAKLPEKSAETYTPSTTNQVISAGQYLAGDQTIKGDSNLVATNIVKDISIFDVKGTFSASSTITSGKTAATAKDILTGTSAFLDGAQLNGTMVNNGDVSTTFDPLTQTSISIDSGYTSGGEVTLTDDLETALSKI